MSLFFIALLALTRPGGIRLLKTLFSVRKSGAIGIIGGADGPTAIFTASRPRPHTAIVPLLYAVAVFGCVLFIWQSCFRPKQN